MKIHASIILLFLCLPYGNAQIITTFAGNGTAGFSGDGGPAINAQFYFPVGVVSDRLGNIYLADNYNSVIHKVDSNGIMTRFAGNGLSGYSGDGGPATAAQLHLQTIVGLAVDTNGNVFICAPPVVRMVNTSGIITTIAGNGSFGSSGDGGPATAAELFDPEGIYIDIRGNIYITDADVNSNNIRMINSSGVISTIAGSIASLGFSGDGGPATNAQLKLPEGIAGDDSGNIYFADIYNNRIRKISALGIITTVAGGGSYDPKFYDGVVGSSLMFDAPIGVAVDGSRNVFFSDAGKQAIYKMDTGGIVHGIAGNGTAGFYGDGGPAISCELNNPRMIYIDNLNNLLVSDTRNYRFRKIWFSKTSTPLVSMNPGELSISPNPIWGNTLTCIINTSINEEATLVITNIVGQPIYSGTHPTNKSKSIQLSAPPGMYFVTSTTSAGKVTSKLIIE